MHWYGGLSRYLPTCFFDKLLILLSTKAPLGRLWHQDTQWRGKPKKKSYQHIAEGFCGRQTQPSYSRDKNVCVKQFFISFRKKASLRFVISIKSIAVEVETSACDENNLKKKIIVKWRNCRALNHQNCGKWHDEIISRITTVGLFTSVAFVLWCPSYRFVPLPLLQSSADCAKTPKMFTLKKSSLTFSWALKAHLIMFQTSQIHAGRFHVLFEQLLGFVQRVLEHHVCSQPETDGLCLWDDWFHKNLFA